MVNRMWSEKASGSIERAKWLDIPADTISGIVHRLLPPGRAKSVLSGSALGHPAHPLVVTVPIGAWISATFLDVVGGQHGRAAAQRLIALGIIATVPAAFTGASDWSDTLGAERRVGLVHAATVDTALLLYVASWRARRRGDHRAGVRRGMLAAGALGFGGWLGGHLAYAIGVGVDTTAFLHGPEEWTDVAAEADLAESVPVGVSAAGVPLLLVRRGGTVFALNGRCTHRGAPLHEGRVEDGRIECPWHKSRFELDDGRVARGPATRPQPSFSVRVVDGRVQVRSSDEQRALRTNPVSGDQSTGETLD